MEVDDMRLFERAGELGSFSATARELGLSQPTVSKRIAALEARLGVQLVQRTTRRSRLTDAGRRYHALCRDVLSRVAEGEAALRGEAAAMAGVVRLSAPASFARRMLLPAIGSFGRAHPEVEVELRLGDRVVDLVEEAVDVAVRFGRFPDSSLKRIRVGVNRSVLVASPAYLRREGLPRTAAELGARNVLMFFGRAGGSDLVLTRGGRRETVRVTGHLRANHLDLLHDAVRAGAGIGVLPRWLVSCDLRDGTLCPVLPRFVAAEAIDCSIVHPAGDYTPRRVRALIDHLATELRGAPDLA